MRLWKKTLSLTLALALTLSMGTALAFAAAGDPEKAQLVLFNPTRVPQETPGTIPSDDSFEMETRGNINGWDKLAGWGSADVTTPGELTLTATDLDPVEVANREGVYVVYATCPTTDGALVKKVQSVNVTSETENVSELSLTAPDIRAAIDDNNVHLKIANTFLKKDANGNYAARPNQNYEIRLLGDNDKLLDTFAFTADYTGVTVAAPAVTSAAFTTLTADGATNATTTTELTITLDKDIDLLATEVTLTGATKGALTDNDNNTYTLEISDIIVADSADVTVALARDGFTFTPANKTTAVYVKAPVAISNTAISGVTAPVTGATAATAVTPDAQFTGTVAWAPALVAGNFKADTVYTATITLTPTAGFKLDGVTADFFTVAGATPVTNLVNSGIVTATFPTTAKQVVTLSSITADGKATQQTTGRLYITYDIGNRDLAENTTYAVSGGTGTTTAVAAGGEDMVCHVDITGGFADGETLTLTPTNPNYTFNPASGTVTVHKEAANTACYIRSFNIGGANGAIATDDTIAVTVPFGTDVTTLVPAITLATGATVAPVSGLVQDFTSPVVYTVTAKDGTTTRAYTVTVTVAAAPPAPPADGGGGREPSSPASDPAVIAKVTDTLDTLKELDNLDPKNLPAGVTANTTAGGASIATVPVALTSGAATVSSSLINSLGSAAKNVGIEFKIQNGISGPSVSVLIPGGFGKITEPGRLAFPMGYKEKATDNDKMLKTVKTEGATSFTAQIGENYNLPVAATIKIGTKIANGTTVNIYKYDDTAKKMVVVGTAKVADGKVVFSTKMMGQFLITTGKI